jgi:hypothetical protein
MHHDEIAIGVRVPSSPLPAVRTIAAVRQWGGSYPKLRAERRLRLEGGFLVAGASWRARDGFVRCPAAPGDVAKATEPLAQLPFYGAYAATANNYPQTSNQRVTLLCIRDMKYGIAR